jgi:hypothetical protein
VGGSAVAPWTDSSSPCTRTWSSRPASSMAKRNDPLQESLCQKLRITTPSSGCQDTPIARPPLRRSENHWRFFSYRRSASATASGWRRGVGLSIGSRRRYRITFGRTGVQLILCAAARLRKAVPDRPSARQHPNYVSVRQAHAREEAGQMVKAALGVQRLNSTGADGAEQTRRRRRRPRPGQPHLSLASAAEGVGSREDLGHPDRLMLRDRPHCGVTECGATRGIELGGAQLSGSLRRTRRWLRLRARRQPREGCRKAEARRRH